MRPLEKAVADAEDLLLTLAGASGAADRARARAEDRPGPPPRAEPRPGLARELLEGFDAGAFVQRAQAGDERGGRSARGTEMSSSRAILADGLAAQARTQRALGAGKTAHLLEHLDRNAHRAGLLGQTAQDRLADPDGGVSGEVKTALGLEAIHRHDQTQIALFDQVEHRQTPPAVPGPRAPPGAGWRGRSACGRRRPVISRRRQQARAAAARCGRSRPGSPGSRPARRRSPRRLHRFRHFVRQPDAGAPPACGSTEGVGLEIGIGEQRLVFTAHRAGRNGVLEDALSRSANVVIRGSRMITGPRRRDDGLPAPARIDTLDASV